MPRNGSGVYSLPAGSTVTNGDTSDATDINTPFSDLETDMNTARPVVAGGTGATSAAAARQNLAVALELIESQAASNSASLDFTGFDASKYLSYRFVLQFVNPVSATQLAIRTSTDGGSSFDSGASDYTTGLQYFDYSGATVAGVASTTSSIPLQAAAMIAGGTNGYGTTGVLEIIGPQNGSCTVSGRVLSTRDSTSSYWSTDLFGFRVSGTAVNAVRFLMLSGNINGGTITMYGVRG